MSWSSLMAVHSKSFTKIEIFMPFWGKILQSSLGDFFYWNFRLNSFNANTRMTKEKHKKKKQFCNDLVGG